MARLIMKEMEISILLARIQQHSIGTAWLKIKTKTFNFLIIFKHYSH